MGDLVAELVDDVGRFKKVLDRAFPGEQIDEADLEARREKMRRSRAKARSDEARAKGDQPVEADSKALVPTDAETEVARLQEEARGKHTLYAVTARHNRTKPFSSDFVGHAQAVRVTLPPTLEAARPIWTHYGVVKKDDHLAFSIKEIVDGHAERFGRRPKVERVDLITGARHHDLDRFAPLSVFLAYEHADDSVPIFYVYESGSAQGNPAKLYWAEALDATIIDTAGFLFTPFARVNNIYKGRLIMNRAKTEPSLLSINIALDEDFEKHYIQITASYAVVEPGPVYWPITTQIEAAMRVFAIAQGMGCELELWERGFAQLGRSTLDWITEPPHRGKPQGYSGCSQ